ncbi:site-specific recombinase, phage integrase family [Helicobacter mustelae]|uniref:hypothetical protein n=1 Tax=Helicobacter mustelae TaxID=217 RepID=UPI000DFF8B11|nr:hypothetical protein [Helicobacter mustelae]STP12130.1 site-specific recombinase, phage integrase family [Helicobacter mustelae]
MKNSTIAIENSTQKNKMGIHKTNHKHNATLKTSQKTKGVRSKNLNNGDIAYYVRWTGANGERHERKVVTKDVDTISVKDVNSFIATLSENFANKTINTITCTLAAILNLVQMSKQ